MIELSLEGSTYLALIPSYIASFYNRQGNCLDYENKKIVITLMGLLHTCTACKSYIVGVALVPGCRCRSWSPWWYSGSGPGRWSTTPRLLLQIGWISVLVEVIEIFVML